MLGYFVNVDYFPFSSTNNIDYNSEYNLSENAFNVKNHKKIEYPELGQPIECDKQSIVERQVYKIAKISLVIIAFVAITTLTGGLSLPIAIGVAVISTLVYFLAKKIFNNFYSHRYRLDIESGVNNQTAPKLGEYVSTDVRISNHTTESFEWKKQLIDSA